MTDMTKFLICFAVLNNLVLLMLLKHCTGTSSKLYNNLVLLTGNLQQLKEELTKLQLKLQYHIIGQKDPSTK